MAFHEGSNSNHGNRAPSRWSTKVRWVTQRKIPTRRRKLQTVRLGGKKRHLRGMFIVIKLVKRIRIRWLKLKYSLLLKKLKNFYYSLVKELLEGGSTFEAAQQRIIMESYFAVPILGLSLSA